MARLNHPAQGCNAVVVNCVYHGVTIKTDGHQFFATVCGCLLCRSSVSELAKLIDKKLDGGNDAEAGVL